MPTLSSTRSLRLKSSMRSNMNVACCLHPTSHDNRSLSPNPNEPARPSPLTLDSIFALAALPTNHPHALEIELPAHTPEDHQDADGIPLSVLKLRRVKKMPSSAAFSSGLMHSGLVRRVGRRLRRRATFGDAVGGDGSLSESGVGSALRDDARFDADAKRLSSGEVLGAVGTEEDDDVDAGDVGPTRFMSIAAAGDGQPPTLRLREL